MIYRLPRNFTQLVVLLIPLKMTLLKTNCSSASFIMVMQGKHFSSLFIQKIGDPIRKDLKPTV